MCSHKSYQWNSIASTSWATELTLGGWSPCTISRQSKPLQFYFGVEPFQSFRERTAPIRPVRDFTGLCETVPSRWGNRVWESEGGKGWELPAQRLGNCSMEVQEWGDGRWRWKRFGPRISKTLPLMRWECQGWVNVKVGVRGDVLGLGSMKLLY